MLYKQVGNGRGNNPCVSINCIRFVGYNLSLLGAPLCLYGGQSKGKIFRNNTKNNDFYLTHSFLNLNASSSGS